MTTKRGSIEMADHMPQGCRASACWVGRRGRRDVPLSEIGIERKASFITYL